MTAHKLLPYELYLYRGKYFLNYVYPPWGLPPYPSFRLVLWGVTSRSVLGSILDLFPTGAMGSDLPQ